MTNEDLDEIDIERNDYDDMDVVSSTSIESQTYSSTITDIANGIEDHPVQPHNHRFPNTYSNNKSRSFNPFWFDKHIWLEYSIARDAAFCYACRFFSNSSRRSEDSFVATGYKNWKNATGKSVGWRNIVHPSRYGRLE